MALTGILARTNRLKGKTTAMHFPWGQRAGVMGVINLTPDSFSDGGRCEGAGAALRQAERLLRQGADVLDLGAQSTRPGDAEVGAETELERLLPALHAIRAAQPQAILCIDTFWGAVAEAALAAGANWINDVSGGRRDPSLLRAVAGHRCPLVLMHSRGNSHTMDQLCDYNDLVADVRQELEQASERALAAGVELGQLIWDPGLGFAKTTHQNLELLRRLDELKAPGLPLLVGPSRKRFIGEVVAETRPRARIWGTAAVCALAVARGADLVRVHDVGPMAQVMLMAGALGKC
jgi:dihydropteroate synthase